jgi:hypothetical protein
MILFYHNCIWTATDHMRLGMKFSTCGIKSMLKVSEFGFSIRDDSSVLNLIVLPDELLCPSLIWF